MSCLRVSHSEFSGDGRAMCAYRTKEVSSGLKTKYIPRQQMTPTKRSLIPCPKQRLCGLDSG
jgi:hypothetical protein